MRTPNRPLLPLLEDELPEPMRPPRDGADLVVVLTGRNVDRARLESVLEST